MGGAFFLSPHIVFFIPLCSKVEKLGGVFQVDKFKSLRVKRTVLEVEFAEVTS